MADVTMCSGRYCPLKKKCYRFTAQKGVWQSMFFTPPYDKTFKKCEFFISNEGRTINF
jgi:hypothetical protein